MAGCSIESDYSYDPSYCWSLRGGVVSTTVLTRPNDSRTRSNGSPSTLTYTAYTRYASMTSFIDATQTNYFFKVYTDNYYDRCLPSGGMDGCGFTYAATECPHAHTGLSTWVERGLAATACCPSVSALMTGGLATATYLSPTTEYLTMPTTAPGGSAEVVTSIWNVAVENQFCSYVWNATESNMLPTAAAAILTGNHQLSIKAITVINTTVETHPSTSWWEPTVPPTSSPPAASSSNNSTALGIGVSMGGAAFTIAVVLGGLFLWRRHKKAKLHAGTQDEDKWDKPELDGNPLSELYSPPEHEPVGTPLCESDSSGILELDAEEGGRSRPHSRNSGADSVEREVRPLSAHSQT